MCNSPKEVLVRCYLEIMKLSENIHMEKVYMF